MDKEEEEFPNRQHIGEVHLPRSKNSTKDRVRIVHISDTHFKHSKLRSVGISASSLNQAIPDGDILIHSGDFSKKKLNKGINSDERDEIIAEFNEWMGSFNHDYKIFVAGNHETLLNGMSKEDIQSRLNHMIYIDQSTVTLFGINFYGFPQTSAPSIANSFHVNPMKLNQIIFNIPPFNILDLAWVKSSKHYEMCEHCHKRHVSYGHWGCQVLRDEIFQRVHPIAHLFGHVHDDNGHLIQQGILFVNSAMDIDLIAHSFDVVFDLETDDYKQLLGESDSAKDPNPKTSSSTLCCSSDCLSSCIIL